jgi:thymidylate kinase
MIRKILDGRRPIVVSFSGIDGSGKSTQIERLRSRLSDAGVRVLLVTFWNDVARLTRFREVTGHALFQGEKGVGTPAQPINRRDKNVRSWYMTAARFFLYFVDAISLRVVAGKALKAGVDVVIFDRYLYDELANLTLRSRVSRSYVRLLMMLVPRPDISFLLDADPIEARARKPEYPLDFLYSNRRSYLTLSQLVGGMRIVAPQPVPDVARQVLCPVLSKLLPGVFRERKADKKPAVGQQGVSNWLEPATTLRADSPKTRSFAA